MQPYANHNSSLASEYLVWLEFDLARIRYPRNNENVMLYCQWIMALEALDA